jgi:hypothetical protein
MTLRRACLLLAVLPLTAEARAQSHRHIGGASLADVAQRLGGDQQEVQRLIEGLLKRPDLFSPEEARRFKDQAGPELTNNPNLRDQVRDALDKGHFDPDQIERLKRLAQPPADHRPPDLGQPSPMPQPGTGDTRRPPQPPEPSRPPPPPEPPPQPREKPKESLDNLAALFERIGSGERGRGVRDAFGRFVRNRVLDRGPFDLNDPASLARRLKGVSDYLPLERIGKSLSSAKPDRLPSLPRFGSWEGPSRPGEGTRTVLLWSVALTTVVAALWLGLRVARGPAGAAARGWRLGPWPVRPERIASRGDLVKAFEYLACLLLGQEALHRHHLDLGARLHATALARLYEQARYAPPDEPLPAAELAAARRDLCRLAGVGPA